MKKEVLVQAMNQVNTISRFGLGNLDGLEDYLIFRDGFLSAYSSNVAVSIPLDVGFNAMVSANEFYKFIKKCSAEISLTSVDDEEVLVKAGKTKAGFKKADLFDLIPDLNIAMVKTWMKVPDDFAEVLKFCCFSIIDDESQGVINCAYVKPDCVVATDAVRVTERRFAKKAPKDFTFFLPKKLVNPIADFNCEKVGIASGWVYFKTVDGAIISVNSLTGEFPQNYRDMFVIDGVEIEMPDTLAPAIAHVSTIDAGMEDIRCVFITIRKGEIVCRAENDKAWAEEKVDYNYKGKEIQFMASPDFLNDILPKCKKFIVGDGTLLIKAENFTHVMSLVI